MNRRTCVFLVLLQLAIGWHLLYEGYWKINENPPPWSAQGYLQHATGPFALPVRWAAGDPAVTRQDGKFVLADHTK